MTGVSLTNRYRFCEPGLAAECLRQADGPPAQGERRAPARV